ncbi:hypothetical protein C7451_101526 [Blastomonas natatoria]|uniref:Uncharacterized protein n=1 Tax=Blastomonas natatoria TaxID=34015 RepID=A0A2V3VCL5_9SPHN|nr:hypothetical protein [Blastomonas natatoria]PXW79457.1 hypothetical protein C7451_101526 [Blastomonas natatoria]
MVAAAEPGERRNDAWAAFGSNGSRDRLIPYREISHLLILRGVASPGLPPAGKQDAIGQVLGEMVLVDYASMPKSAST